MLYQVRKKSMVDFEAMLFVYDTDNLAKIKSWMGDNMGNYGKDRHMTALAWLEIKTLKVGTGNTIIASEGDYIIKGSVGEFWAVNSNLFNMTYDILTNIS